MVNQTLVREKIARRHTLSPCAKPQPLPQTRWVLLVDPLRVKVEGGSVIARENPTPQTTNPKAYTPNEEDLFVVGFDGESVVARSDRLVLGAVFSGLG